MNVIVDSQPFVVSLPGALQEGCWFLWPQVCGAPCDRSSCAHCPTGTEHSEPRMIVREGKVSNGYHRDRVSPSVTVHTHCQVVMQGTDLKIPGTFSKLKHSDLPQTYSACGCLNSHKGLYCTPRAWEALVQYGPRQNESPVCGN